MLPSEFTIEKGAKGEGRENSWRDIKDQTKMKIRAIISVMLFKHPCLLSDSCSFSKKSAYENIYKNW